MLSKLEQIQTLIQVGEFPIMNLKPLNYNEDSKLSHFNKDIP